MWLSPSAVSVQRGAATEVSLTFVDRAQRQGIYTVSVLGSVNMDGVNVKPIGSSIISGSGGSVRLSIGVAPNADVGKHVTNVILTGKEGILQTTLTVNVVP